MPVSVWHHKYMMEVATALRHGITHWTTIIVTKGYKAGGANHQLVNSSVAT